VFPNLIQVGPLRLPAYAALLSMGLLGGVLASVWLGARRRIDVIRSFDAALLGAIGGLLGARAAYVWVNWQYFRQHLLEGLRLWAGGLAWQGGLLLGLLLVAVYGVRYRLPLGKLLDAVSLGAAVLTLFVWLGSGVAHDVYGRETFPGDGLLWRLSADLPDLYGLRAPRINLPALGAFWSALVVVLLWVLRDRLKVPGSMLLAYLALTGLGGLWLVPLQADAVPYLFHVRLDWWFYFWSLVTGSAGLVVLFIRAHARRPQSGSRVTHSDYAHRNQHR
jgi:phosphatidylglycerol:prolipoprotein diacylglycerol transferase